MKIGQSGGIPPAGVPGRTQGAQGTQGTQNPRGSFELPSVRPAEAAGATDPAACLGSVRGRSLESAIAAARAGSASAGTIERRFVEAWVSERYGAVLDPSARQQLSRVVMTSLEQSPAGRQLLSAVLATPNRD